MNGLVEIHGQGLHEEHTAAQRCAWNEKHSPATAITSSPGRTKEFRRKSNHASGQRSLGPLPRVLHGQRDIGAEHQGKRPQLR
jgi:hypothetical protein